MSHEYYILQPDGGRAGPYAEEEVLDLLESGAVKPSDQCLDAATSRVCEAGSMFRVIDPEAVTSAAARTPVPWQPVPFPEAAKESPFKAADRLLYRGNPCALTYWRSTLIAAALFAGGYFARHWMSGMLAAGLISGSAVMLRAILHRLSIQYSITGARVDVIEGLLSRSSRELRIADIRAINVTCRGLTGLLGIGTLSFSSVAGPQDDVVFQRVWRATALKNMVRRMQDARAASGH